MRRYILTAVVLAVVALFAAVSVTAEQTYPTRQVQEAGNFTNITTATTTTVKASAGRLAGIVVNGGTMGSITIYNNTAGSGATIATIASPIAGMVLPYGVRFGTGLTIVTAEATDITVVWY